MAETHETIADIRKETEARFRELVEAWMKRRSTFQTTVGAMQAFNNVFDRLEAAHKRERGVAVTGSNQLREALRLCMGAMCKYCRADAKARGLPMECVHGCEALLKAKAALAAPPRNCDVGTADEQFERFGPFCNRYDDDCTGCPCDTDSSWNFTNCFARWAQMPYEEGGEK